MNVYHMFLCVDRLRAGTTHTVLEEQADRVRTLKGDGLSLQDFAGFLDLPVSDTLTHVHNLFDRVNEAHNVR